MVVSLNQGYSAILVDVAMLDNLNQGYSAILVYVAMLDNLLQAEDVGENSVQISRI